MKAGYIATLSITAIYRNGVSVGGPLSLKVKSIDVDGAVKVEDTTPTGAGGYTYHSRLKKEPTVSVSADWPIQTYEGDPPTAFQEGDELAMVVTGGKVFTGMILVRQYKETIPAQGVIAYDFSGPVQGSYAWSADGRDLAALGAILKN